MASTKMTAAARDLVEQVYDAYEESASIWMAHWSRTKKRWAKWSIDKRKEILRQAWPAIASDHRPDFHALQHHLKGPDHRDAWLLPLMNLEDLTASNNLLLFLYSRTQEPPAHFSWVDRMPLKLAILEDAVKIKELPGHAMLLMGQKSRQTYGRIIAIGASTELAEDMQQGLSLPVEHGLEVLKSEAKIYPFLLRCLKLVLYDHNLAPSALVTARSLVKEHAGIESNLRETNVVAWSSVLEHHAEAPYHLPQQNVLQLLGRIVRAKRDEAVDVLWALREDPGFFMEELKESCPDSQRPCSTLVHRACRNVILWDITVSDIDDLEDVAATQDIDVTRRLPPDYDGMLYESWVMNDVIIGYALHDLREALMCIPNYVQNGGVRKAQPGVRPSMASEVSQSAHVLRQLPPVFQMITHLLDSEKAARMGGLNILNEVERIVSRDPEQRNLISSSLAKALSEMAAFAQIHDAFLHHQPKIRQRTISRHAWIGKCAMRQLSCVDVLEKCTQSMNLECHAEPESAFEYPVDKKRSNAIVKRLRRAEAKLDTFWAMVDKHFVTKTGKTLLGWMGRRVETREIRRTAEWQGRKPLGEKKNNANLPPPDYRFGAGTETKPSTKPKLEPKQKPKTRGQSDHAKEPKLANPPEASEISKDNVQFFVLDSRPYSTACSLFPVSKEDRLKNQVAWEDFVHLMSKVGFRIESLHGSGWYFEPIWRRNAPIIFHDLHSKVLRPDVVRVIGTRLANRYGWSSESFVQA